MSISLVTAARPCHAYDFEVTSRTEAYAYQLRRFNRDGLVLLNRRRITQYLGLRVFNLLDPGQDAYKPDGSRRPPALLWMHAMMRFHTDFGNFARSASQIPELEDNQFELLLGAIEARNLWGWVDLTLGRQFDSELMDFFAFDGVRVRVNSRWHLFAETHFGVQVNRTHPFAAAVFETDGTSGNGPEDEAIAPTFGVALGVDDGERLQLRAAYRGVVSRADVLLDRHTRTTEPRWGVDQELLFGHVAVGIPLLETKIAGALRYSLLTGQFDEMQLSVGQPFGASQLLQLELLRSRPHFDGDSIFNLFSVEPYAEVAGRYAMKLVSRLTIEGRAGYRWFWNDDQQLADQPGALSVSGLAAWQSTTFGSTLELYVLDGNGAHRLGGDLGGSWLSPRWVYGRRIRLDGRMSIVHALDDNPAVAALTTFGMQLGAAVRLLPGIRGHLLLENNISSLLHRALRVLAVLDMVFAP